MCDTDRALYGKPVLFLDLLITKKSVIYADKYYHIHITLTASKIFASQVSCRVPKIFWEGLPPDPLAVLPNFSTSCFALSPLVKKNPTCVSSGGSPEGQLQSLSLLLAHLLTEMVPALVWELTYTWAVALSPSHESYTLCIPK